MIFRRLVKSGQRIGRTLGFPTLNLNAGSVLKHYPHGVYVAIVSIHGRAYKGALYLGPKMDSKRKAHLEIYVLDFQGHLYGEWISFEVLKKIRDSKRFGDLDSLKKAIQNDLYAIDR